MIHGYFDPSGRPYIQALVAIPSLQTRPQPIPLLLDTGSDTTLIQPGGAVTLGIDTGRLTPTGRSRGIGGTLEYAMEPAFIAFPDKPWPWQKTRLVYFRTEVAVAIEDQHSMNMPSLLGRDILDRCRMIYDRPGSKLQFAPRQADGTAPL